MTEALLSVKGLTKYFPVIKGVVRSRRVGEIKAVDGVNFEVMPGETLGLVGESGCGKTTTGRLVLRLLEPSGGQVYYHDVELTSLRQRDMDRYRQKLQIIFQDPYASLNPRITVGDAIAEPLIAHGLARRRDARERVLRLLDVVGLAPFHYNRYPRSSPVGNGSAWASRGPWCWNPNSSLPTNRCQRSMSPSRRRSLTYWSAFRRSSG